VRGQLDKIGVAVVRTPAELEFFRRLHLARVVCLVSSGFVTARCLHVPRTAFEALLFVGILVCVGKLVVHLVIQVGFRLWVRRFRPDGANRRE